MMTWPCRKLAVSHCPQLTADRILADRHTKLVPDPLAQIDDAPANHAVARRYGATLHDRCKRCQLFGRQLGRFARRLAIDQPIRTVGVEFLDPVTDDLNRDAAQPSCLAAAGTVIDRSNRQEPPGLGSVSSMPGRQTAGPGVKIDSKWQGGQ